MYRRERQWPLGLGFLLLGAIPFLCREDRNRVACLFMAVAADVDYFDRLRGVNSGLIVEDDVRFSGFNNLIDVLTVATDDNNDEEQQLYRLGAFATFLPLSSSDSSSSTTALDSDSGSTGSQLRSAILEDALVALLAIHHFNYPQTSPFLNSEELEQCPIKWTTELWDTAFSPIRSTRLYTSVLQRNHSLETPLSAGVVGAYRSAVTSPLAILTGVNNIPQVSYGSTSTDFDVKEQYPLFGRTCQSSVGEAAVSVDYFKTQLEATHVGVMFVTDAFGSALQKAFQDAAAEVNITTNNVAFSFATTEDGKEEIRSAVRALKATEYRLFYVICFETHYKLIMEAAASEGLIGDDYVWILDGIGPQTLHKILVFEPDSPLSKATNGIGLISTGGGLRSQVVKHNNPTAPPIEDDPTSGFEIFRKVYRAASEDPVMIDYLREKLPKSLEEDIPGFDLDQLQLRGEPSIWGSLLYDAITMLALSYCRAYVNMTAPGGVGKEDVAGSDAYDYFRQLDSQGASGRVKIDPDTATRDYITLSRTMHNFQYDGLDANGNQVYKDVPTSHYADGKWETILQRDFVYGDGGTETPQSLPDPKINHNFIGLVGRIIGYALMSLVMICSVVCVVWLCYYMKEPVVQASQPLFLIMIALGAFVMASTIIPLSFEEDTLGKDVDEMLTGLDTACQAAPWLYLSGAIVLLSALLAKTRGVQQAYINPELDFIHITTADIVCSFISLFIVNMTVMIPWTVVAPLQWNRVVLDATDIFERPVESYGTCSNDTALPFVVVVILLNILIVIMGSWWAYQSRNIETEYHESRYIGISMASILQAWCMGIPILIVVSDNPQAKYFVQAGIIFVTAMAALLLIYIPKMLAINSDRIKAATEEKRIAYSNFRMQNQRPNSSSGGVEGSITIMNRRVSHDTGSFSLSGYNDRSGEDLLSSSKQMLRDDSDKLKDLEVEKKGEDSIDGRVPEMITSTDSDGSSPPSTRPASEGSDFSTVDPLARPVPVPVPEDESQQLGSSTLPTAAAAEVAPSISHSAPPARGLQRSGDGQSSRPGSLLNLAASSFRGLSSRNFAHSSRNLNSSVNDLGTGIRIVHNPRSRRNLLAGGGIEYSRRQLDFLDEFVSDDDEDNRIQEESEECEDKDEGEDEEVALTVTAPSVAAAAALLQREEEQAEDHVSPRDKEEEIEEEDKEQGSHSFPATTTRVPQEDGEEELISLAKDEDAEEHVDESEIEEEQDAIQVDGKGLEPHPEEQSSRRHVAKGGFCILQLHYSIPSAYIGSR